MSVGNGNPQELPDAISGIPLRPIETGITASAPEPSMAEELAQIPDEPLLPVEQKLIAGSLILGVLLLGLLVWLSYTYF
jgi:hypothetical protein